MSAISALFSLGVIQATAQAAAASTLNLAVSEIAREFFTHLFLYPGQHLIAVCIFAVAFIGITVGLVFLIKKVYEKYYLNQPQP